MIGVCIEFVGVPGAGKSTLAKQLVEALEDAGRECLDRPTFTELGRVGRSSRIGRIGRIAADVMSGVGLTIALWRLWWYLIPGLFRVYTRRRYWRLVRIWAGMRRMRSGRGRMPSAVVGVFDQGLLQCLPSIYPPSISRGTTSRLTDRATTAMLQILPEIVVIVSLDTEEAAARLRVRRYQRISYDLEDPDLPVRLKPVQEYTEEVLPRLLARKRIKVIQVRGSDPPDLNAARILERLAQWQRASAES